MGREAFRWCWTALPRVSRTFAINIRLLRGTLRDAVCVGYLLCRAADALEDSWPGAPEQLRERFGWMLSSLDGDRAAARTLAAQAATLPPRDDLALLAHLPRVLAAFDLLPEAHRAAVAAGATTLAGGMSRYAARAASRPREAPYLDTEAELEDYCFVVAGCVGVMLTELLAAEQSTHDPEAHARRLALAPRVGHALQLTNILLDWPVDMRRGRCHVPASWLAEYGLTPGQLVDAGTPATESLARRLESRAREALASVPDYVESVPASCVRFRLFCLWPALWALGSLEHARRDPRFPWGPSRPRLPRPALVSAAVGSLLLQPAALARLRGANRKR